MKRISKNDDESLLIQDDLIDNEFLSEMERQWEVKRTQLYQENIEEVQAFLPLGKKPSVEALIDSCDTYTRS